MAETEAAVGKSNEIQRGNAALERALWAITK